MENTINMGKIIISLKLLGEQHFVNTALFHADLLAEEKGLNKELLSLEISAAKSGVAFKEVFERHFKEELKLLI